MTVRALASSAALAALLVAPLGSFAQESHAEAKAQVERHDHHHHTKAKIVGGEAAGGATIGAVAGGPVGAVAGAGIGAGAGLVTNKVRKHHAIKKREHEEPPY